MKSAFRVYFGSLRKHLFRVYLRNPWSCLLTTLYLSGPPPGQPCLNVRKNKNKIVSPLDNDTALAGWFHHSKWHQTSSCFWMNDVKWSWILKYFTIFKPVYRNKVINLWYLQYGTRENLGRDFREIYECVGHLNTGFVIGTSYGQTEESMPIRRYQSKLIWPKSGRFWSGWFDQLDMLRHEIILKLSQFRRFGLSSQKLK